MKLRNVDLTKAAATIRSFSASGAATGIGAATAFGLGLGRQFLSLAAVPAPKSTRPKSSNHSLERT